MNKVVLLSRDQFRRNVFERDNYKCVVCGEIAILNSKGIPTNLDAHHIYERRLWGGNGGYYINNGASVCNSCHIKCEQTIISCEELHKLCKISKPIKPSQFYSEDKIDKWGNYILPNGNRTKGELFFDESVQKILDPILQKFSKYVKYPRTFHLPWSPKAHDKDEHVMSSTEYFEGQNVVVSAKLDGENTSLYDDYIHCRSLDMLGSHPSRTRIKALWNQIKKDIPKGWRFSIENLQGKHTIHYKNLSDYFVLFAVWNERNVSLSWKEVEEWASLLGLTSCPVLYSGIYDEKLIRNLYAKTYNGDPLEGYVLRIADSFEYKDFHRCVGKFVSNNFVIDQDTHWKHDDMIENELMKVKN